MVLKVVLGVVIMMGGREKCLGGDAAHVETGSSQSSAHFHTSGFEAELTGFDGGDISAGTST
jgi:hypothetical protein